MKIGDQIPEMQHAGNWLNTTTKTIAALVDGYPTIVYFWSTDCNSCKGTISRMKQVCDEYLKEMNLISVHTPLKGKGKEIDIIKQAVEENRMTEPVLIESEEAMSRLFRVRSVPAFYLFDRVGRLRHVQSGSKGMTMLRSRIARVIETE